MEFISCSFVVSCCISFPSNWRFGRIGGINTFATDGTSYEYATVLSDVCRHGERKLCTHHHALGWVLRIRRRRDSGPYGKSRLLRIAAKWGTCSPRWRAPWVSDFPPSPGCESPPMAAPETAPRDCTRSSIFAAPPNLCSAARRSGNWSRSLPSGRGTSTWRAPCRTSSEIPSRDCCDYNRRTESRNRCASRSRRLGSNLGWDRSCCAASVCPAGPPRCTARRGGTDECADWRLEGEQPLLALIQCCHISRHRQN